MKVLISDDSKDIRSELSLLLATNGYAVETAKNGTEAIRKQADDPADVILMDMRMPRKDGLTASKMIKKIDPCVSIGAVTGFRHDYQPLDELNVIDFWIDKPLIRKEKIKNLLHEVRSHCELTRTRIAISWCEALTPRSKIKPDLNNALSFAKRYIEGSKYSETKLIEEIMTLTTIAFFHQFSEIYKKSEKEYKRIMELLSSSLPHQSELINFLSKKDIVAIENKLKKDLRALENLEKEFFSE